MVGPAPRFTLWAALGLLAWTLAAGAAGAAEVARSPAEVMRAVVGVTARVPPTARTAETLGRERAGSGVVIDADGLVLTIGYLVMEADEVTVTREDGKAFSAAVVAYDHDTGFGLLRVREGIDIRPIVIGDSTALGESELVLVVGGGRGPRTAIPASVVSRRPFAGYWEYMLDSAIFTMPPHTEFGGAALIGRDGRLLGIGSLYVNDARGGEGPSPGNMFVPIDLLKPVLGDLLAHGRSTAEPRPWIGVSSNEHEGRVHVRRVSPGSPAAKAGLAQGDIILGVGEVPVRSLAELYQALWRSGPAGTEIRLKVLQGVTVRELPVRTIDRRTWLRLEPTY